MPRIQTATAHSNRTPSTRMQWDSKTQRVDISNAMQKWHRRAYRCRRMCCARYNRSVWRFVRIMAMHMPQRVHHLNHSSHVIIFDSRTHRHQFPTCKGYHNPQNISLLRHCVRRVSFHFSAFPTWASRQKQMATWRSTCDVSFSRGYFHSTQLPLPFDSKQRLETNTFRFNAHVSSHLQFVCEGANSIQIPRCHFLIQILSDDDTRDLFLALIFLPYPKFHGFNHRIHALWTCAERV